MKYDKVKMSVRGRVGEYIKNSSDFIVFIDIEKSKVKDGRTQKIEESRKIRFRGDGTTEAGGRIKDLPEVIDYDVDDFLETIKSAVKTQAEKLKAVPEKSKAKPKPKAKEKAKEVEPTKDIDSVKSKIGDYVKGLETSEKKEWAQRFLDDLGTMNYSESDDLEALESLLSEMK